MTIEAGVSDPDTAPRKPSLLSSYSFRVAFFLIKITGLFIDFFLGGASVKWFVDGYFGVF